MKLAEISDRICKHLRRFEADPKINPPDPVYKTRPYFMTNSRSAGSRVFVKYVSYQNTYSLTKAEAIAYLEWLDAGNVGRHFEQQKEAKNEKPAI